MESDYYHGLLVLQGHKTVLRKFCSYHPKVCHYWLPLRSRVFQRNANSAVSVVRKTRVCVEFRDFVTL